MNNLTGLISINLGILDEITFKGFMKDYKKYYTKLANLSCLKINLSISVTLYKGLESYIEDFIKIDSPKIKEKYLLTNLNILTEEKMRELVELVYYKANVEKLVVEISRENVENLSYVLSEDILRDRFELYSMALVTNFSKFQMSNKRKILKIMASFYKAKKKDKAIICK